MRERPSTIGSRTPSVGSTWLGQSRGDAPTLGPRDAVVAAALFVLTAVYLGLHHPLQRAVLLDAATWDMMSLGLLRGEIPHRDVFLHKTPGAAWLGGAGAWLGVQLGLPPLHGAHLLFLALGALAPVLLFLLCRTTLPLGASLAAALFLVGLDQWPTAALEGVRPKVATVCFGLGGLLAAAHNRLRLAAALGVAATACWQPGIVFLGGTLLFGTRPLLDRVRRVAVGSIASSALLLAGLAAVGSLADFFDQAFLFNLHYVQLMARSPAETLQRLTRVLYVRNTVELLMLGPALLAFAAGAARPPVGLLVASLAYLGLAFVNFQAWPDTILFMPGLAALLGAGLYSMIRLLVSQGATIACVGLLALGCMAYTNDPRRFTTVTYDEQGAALMALAEGVGADENVIAVSVPEFLIHSGRPNGWKWPYLWFGVDAFAVAEMGGDRNALVLELERLDPALIILGRHWGGSLRHAFDEWAEPRYQIRRVGVFPHLRNPFLVYRRLDLQ